eukprot:1027766-Pleurochrysis_carterae.AAC.1
MQSVRLAAENARATLSCGPYCTTPRSCAMYMDKLSRFSEEARHNLLPFTLMAFGSRPWPLLSSICGVLFDDIDSTRVLNEFRVLIHDACIDELLLKPILALEVILDC